MDLDANALKLGDVISLFSEEGNGYLASEGSCDVRILLYHNVTDYLGASQKPWKFSDCLFRVLPQHANGQEKALRKFNKKLAAKKEQADAEPEVTISILSRALYITRVIVHSRSLAQ
jgi:hypothetical protein